MTAVSVPSFAKINIDLRVLNKRPDGYHELRTIFQTISLSDDLHIEFEKRKRTELLLDSSVEIADNLVIRAATLVLERLRISARIRFTLNKRIPMRPGRRFEQCRFSSNRTSGAGWKAHSAVRIDRACRMPGLRRSVFPHRRHGGGTWAWYRTVSAAGSPTSRGGSSHERNTCLDSRGLSRARARSGGIDFDVQVTYSERVSDGCLESDRRWSGSTPAEERFRRGGLSAPSGTGRAEAKTAAAGSETGSDDGERVGHFRRLSLFS